MAYLHGVYVSEAATSIVPGVNAASCLPYIIGNIPQHLIHIDTSTYSVGVMTDAVDASGAKVPYVDGHNYEALVKDVPSQDVTVTDHNGFVALTLTVQTEPEVVIRDTFPMTVGKPVLCKTWKDFLNQFGATDDSVTGEDPSTIMAVARHWYKRVGGGDAFFVPVDLDNGDIESADLTDALSALDTVYEEFGVYPSVILCPRYGSSHAAEINAKCVKYGSGFGAIAVLDIDYDWGNGSPTLPLRTTYLSYAAPRCVAGAEIVPPSAVVLGTMAATDAANGGFPYVSPSNKLAYIDGLVDNGGSPLFFDREAANDNFNAHGVVTFRHNAKGWVVWGNNTSAYPGNTDPKDRFIPIRRVFQYVKNDFLVFGEPRIDNPINKRQLEGVLNSYNMRLQGFTGAGMVNSASVALDADLNTPANLLDGRVFIRTLISPPPPMEQLSNVFEYDVAGFTDSLS